jgi:excisionase family DNA binding protein
MIQLDPTMKPTLSVDEFAIVAGISRSTAFAAVHSGEIPSLRFGKRIRIPTAAVRNMLRLDALAGGPDAVA